LETETSYSCALLVIKPGRMIYEMGGVAENIAGKAISVAAPKIPLEKSTRLPKVPLPFHFIP